MTPARTLHRVVDAVITLLFAPPCATCDGRLDAPSTSAVCLACWDGSHRWTPPWCPRCGQPVSPWRTAAADRCGRCRRIAETLPTRVVGPYEGRLRDVLHAFKYRRPAIAGTGHRGAAPGSGRGPPRRRRPDRPGAAARGPAPAARLQPGARFRGPSRPAGPRRAATDARDEPADVADGRGSPAQRPRRLRARAGLASGPARPGISRGVPVSCGRRTRSRTA